MKTILSKLLHYAGRSILRWAFEATRLLFKEQAFDLSKFQNYERVHYMDESLPEDIEDILEISAILEIREYDIFNLAYHWWFGKVASPRVLENHFSRYMFNKIVPHWVRQYNRMVLDLRDSGTLDREELGISRLPSATPESVRTGLRYTVMLFSALALIILFAELTLRFSTLPCMFPPCY